MINFQLPRAILYCALFTSLAGCTMAPNYTRPGAPVPGAWPAAVTQTATNPVAQTPRWESFFTDPRLRRLVETALNNNRDVRIAVLNVQRARGMHGIQRGQLLPAVDATASANVSRLPASSSEPRRNVESYDVNLGVFSWEIDFFGRIRSLKDRALQEYLATEQASRSAQILLVSSVANSWLALAADRDNLRISRTTLEAQQGSYDLVKKRFDLGLIPELDVYRVRTQVETARRDVAQFTQQVAQGENALALLAGAPVPANLLPDGLSSVSPLASLSEGLSSEVLLTRPDVLQAEALLRAAYADIGAARAAFFPRISLTAAVGSASSDLSSLFQTGSGTWTYAPQLVMPIFDTRTWSALKVTKVQREIAINQYERAIQVAFREVADALAVKSTVDEQLAAQEAIVQAAQDTFNMAESRYDKGIDSYLSVLDAQRSLYAAQQGLISLRLAKAANQVQVYAALGGGWDTAITTGFSAIAQSHPPKKR